MVSVDKLTELCSGVALGGTGTANLGSINLGAVDPGDVAAGCPTYIVISMATTAAGASATALFRIVTGTSASPSTTTAEILFQTSIWAMADMTAGTQIFCAPLPHGTDSVPYLQFIALQATVAGGSGFTGTVDCYLTDKPPKHVAYADGAANPA